MTLEECQVTIDMGDAFRDYNAALVDRMKALEDRLSQLELQVKPNWIKPNWARPVGPSNESSAIIDEEIRQILEEQATQQKAQAQSLPPGTINLPAGDEPPTKDRK